MPALSGRRGLDAGLLLAALSVMPVDWQPPAVYEPEREEAERRMAGHDLEDWPTVALALTRSLPIWSQDKDLEVAGLTSTRRGSCSTRSGKPAANPGSRQTLERSPPFVSPNILASLRSVALGNRTWAACKIDLLLAFPLSSAATRRSQVQILPRYYGGPLHARPLVALESGAALRGAGRKPPPATSARRLRAAGRRVRAPRAGIR